MPSQNFRTTADLAAELGDADLGVIDASWHLPAAGRIGASEFLEGHIPGAVFFDIDTIADIESGLPHMLPKPEPLAKAMSELGWATACALSSMTRSGSTRRRGYGGRYAPMGSRTFAFSRAACRNGLRRGVRSKL